MISITLILSLILYLVVYKKYSFLYFVPSIISFIICLLLWIIFVYEFGLNPFFVSDEIVYFEGSTVDSQAGRERALWIYWNQFVILIDNWLGLWPLKFFNLFFLILLVYGLYKIFENKIVFYLPILVLAIPYTATYNFRDLAIWSLTILCFTCLQSKKYFLTLILLICLFFLRPAISLIIIMIILFTYVFLVLKDGKGNKYTYIAILTGLSLFIFNFNNILEKVNAFINPTHFNSNSLTIVEMISNATVYVFFPNPLDSFNKILNYIPNQFGVLYYIVSFFTSISFFIFLLMILYKLIKFKEYKFKINIYQLMVLLSLFIYMPLYSYYLEGSMHIRLRTPFYIFTFLLLISLKRRKSNENTGNKSALFSKN